MKVDPGTFQRPLEYSSACEEATLRLGAFLSRFVFPGLLVLLFGDLGAGKTVLVRGFVEGLKGGGVRSPSFTLVNEYDAAIGVTHADLFRFRTIPGITVTTEHFIVCDGGRFDIVSVEDVSGNGMYVEVLAKKVVSADG